MPPLTSALSAPLLRRLRKGAPWALLLAVVSAQAWSLAWWLSIDDQMAASICCDLSGEASRAATRVARAGDPGLPPWEPRYGLLPQLGAAIFEATGSPEAFRWAVGVCGLLLSVVLFDLGRLLRGPWTGLLAAALSPLVPALAFASRRWDAQLPLGVLVAIGAWLVVRSRGLSRPIPVLLLCALLAVTAMTSPRETDNLLALATLASLVGGAGLRSLVTGRGPAGRPLARWRTLVGCGALAAFASLALPELVQFSSPDGAAYYVAETAGGASAAGTVGGSQGLAAYVGHLFWRALTPSLAWPFDVALVLVILRGRGRAELLSWTLLPLLALSLLPKRNYYYLSVIWPVLPLILALGVAALPLGRRLGWLRGGVGVALVGLGLVQHLDRVEPRALHAGWAAQERWMGGTEDWGRAFQTSDQHLSIAPVQRPWIAPLAAEVAAAASAVPLDPCVCPVAALLEGGLSDKDVALALLPHAPCLRVRPLRTPPPQVAVGALVVEEAHIDAVRANLPAAVGAEVAARLDGPHGPLLVLSAPETTGEGCPPP